MDFKEFRERYQYDPEKDLLGTGGFGRVYRARDVRLDRWVALKVFSRDVPQQYDLINEIKRAISLSHRNICRYYDAEVLRGIDALGDSQEIQVGIMEFLVGGTIDEFLKNNPKYQKELLTDVLCGLNYLHLHQPPIIHRDLKPSNVLIGFEDALPVAKITDFGISKSPNVSGARVSVAGLGTYAYMAPEQLNPAKFGINGKIQCNLDLWSFGAMTVELLTGEAPFGADEAGGSTGQIIERIFRGLSPEDLSKFDEPYRTVLRRCLVLNARERAQSAAELIPLLERPKETPPPPLPPPPPPTIKWFLLAGAVILALIGIYGAWRLRPLRLGPTPEFSPGGGIYADTQRVRITDRADLSIHYTIDGTTPTASSPIYSSDGIVVRETETIKAIAFGSGYSPSQEASATYTISPNPKPVPYPPKPTPPAPVPLPNQAPTPEFSPAGGSYEVAPTVKISDRATKGLVIYYTTDGSMPTTSSAVYRSGGIEVNGSETIRAFALADGYIESAVASAKYTIAAAPHVEPTVDKQHSPVNSYPDWLAGSWESSKATDWHPVSLPGPNGGHCPGEYSDFAFLDVYPEGIAIAWEQDTTFDTLGVNDPRFDYCLQLEQDYSAHSYDDIEIKNEKLHPIANGDGTISFNLDLDCSGCKVPENFHFHRVTISNNPLAEHLTFSLEGDPHKLTLYKSK
jgi:serine/threonine protein kinase